LFAVAELGIDPGPYTVRDLVTMLDAKRRAVWDAVAALRADVLNSGFGRKRAVQFIDVHPYRQAEATPIASKSAGARLLDKVWGAWKAA
jgi:hypothetical protein